MARSMFLLHRGDARAAPEEPRDPGEGPTDIPGGLMSRSILVAAAALLGAAVVSAQRGPAPDPLIRENATVKLADHTYVIPDANVSLVPNVGIVVGSKATDRKSVVRERAQNG